MSENVTPVESGSPAEGAVAKPPPQFVDVNEQRGTAPDEPGEDEAPRIPSKKKAGEGGEKEKPAVAKKAKLKLLDEELELDEDLANKLKEPLEIAAKRKEHIRAANETFQKAAKLNEENEKKFGKDAIRQNPFAVFQLAAEAGIDPTQLVAAYARQALEQEKLTPEQRQFAEERARFEAEKADLDKSKAQVEQEKHAKEVQAYRDRFAKGLAPLLTKFDLPDDEFSVGEIGKAVAAQIRNGQPEDYEAAAELYADRFEESIKRHLDRLSRTPGALMKKYPEIAKRLREEDVASVVRPRPGVRPAGKQTPAPEASDPNQPRSWADEEAEFRARRYGLKK